jgi:hypothetical protein
MTLRPFFAAIAATCLALPVSTALAQDAAVPTVVLISGDLPELHYLPTSLDIEYMQVQGAYTPVPANYAGVVGGAIGGALANAIARQEAKIYAQQRADAELEPLTRHLDPAALEALLKDAFTEALAAEGMDTQALLFSGRQAADASVFQRLPAAKKARRFIVVQTGTIGDGLVDMPLALHDSHRQLRLAVKFDMTDGRIDRRRQGVVRDIAVYSDLMPVVDGVNSLDALVLDDQARVREALRIAVKDAVALAFADHDTPKVGKDDVVGAVTEIGLTEFEGKLVSEANGRALIWTRDDTLVSIPAAQLVTGAELVAAREEETLRRAMIEGERKRLAAEAEGDTSPDAAPSDAEANTTEASEATGEAEAAGPAEATAEADAAASADAPAEADAAPETEAKR